jgi:Transposase DDE domain group 1
VISDFRVMADQQELFGLVASVPTCWRVLSEIVGGGSRPLARITAAVNAARRRAWAQTVTPAHSDKELAEPNYKGFGHYPLLAYCDNTSEPLAGTLRRGSAGSNTVADHPQVLEAAIAALPAPFRRRLMVTCDGAGAGHGLIARLDALAARAGHQLVY